MKTLMLKTLKFNSLLIAIAIATLCVGTSFFTLNAEYDGSWGDNNPDVSGFVSVDDLITIWYGPNETAYTQSYHTFSALNTSDDESYSYDYEFQHALTHYDQNTGQFGAQIAEDKETGSGTLEPSDEPGHSASSSDYQYIYLPDQGLTDKEWYGVRAYTRLEIRPRVGRGDSWSVSADMSFQYREPDD